MIDDSCYRTYNISHAVQLHCCESTKRAILLILCLFSEKIALLVTQAVVCILLLHATQYTLHEYTVHTPKKEEA